MQVDFDPKTSTMTVKLSVNPKGTQLSSTGKTYLLAYERSKQALDGTEASVSVTVTRPAKGGKRK